MVSHAPAVPTHRRRRDTTELTVTRTGDPTGLVEEWRALADRGAPRNPFASPDWTITWLRHFVAERDTAVLAIRRNGELIGIAPWYVRRIAGGIRTVQLAGTVRHPELTELPQVIAAPEEHRSVLRAAIEYWCSRPGAWDWLELPIENGQGWFEPEWLGAGFVVRHKAVRPAVVLPLPADVATLKSSLKRNVTESIRRARNRLDKSGSGWEITAHTGAAVPAALRTLRALHRTRAELPDRRRHPDMLADDDRFACYADAVGRLADHDRAEVLTLDVAGEAVAALLVLRSAQAGYLACSGVAPAWWHVSPVTLLQWTAMCGAVERGDAEMNLSMGPDVAKLRWSEHVVPHMEFVVCGPRTRSRALLTGYAALGAVAGMRRERRRHEVAR